MGRCAVEKSGGLTQGQGGGGKVLEPTCVEFCARGLAGFKVGGYLG